MLAFRHTVKSSSVKLAVARVPQVSRFATKMGAAVRFQLERRLLPVSVIVFAVPHIDISLHLMPEPGPHGA